MAGNPRIVTEDTVFTWDGGPQRLARGQVIDVPAGSALEDAIGLDHLVPMFGAAAAPSAAPAPPAPPAPRPTPPVPPQAPAASTPAPAPAKAAPAPAAGSSDKEGKP